MAQTPAEFGQVCSKPHIAMARIFCALLVLLALTAAHGSQRADEALDACGLPKGYYPVSHCFNVWIPTPLRFLYNFSPRPRPAGPLSLSFLLSLERALSLYIAHTLSFSNTQTHTDTNAHTNARCLMESWMALRKARAGGCMVKGV